MTPQQTSDLKELGSHITEGMETYLKDNGEDCGYTREDIKVFAGAIESYVLAVNRATDPESIMDEVRKTVQSLNRLNVKCHGGLIESDQREEICELINKAAGHAGFEVGEDDLTEEWREW